MSSGIQIPSGYFFGCTVLVKDYRNVILEWSRSLWLKTPRAAVMKGVGTQSSCVPPKHSLVSVKMMRPPMFEALVVNIQVNGGLNVAP